MNGCREKLRRIEAWDMARLMFSIESTIVQTAFIGIPALVYFRTIFFKLPEVRTKDHWIKGGVDMGNVLIH